MKKIMLILLLTLTTNVFSITYGYGYSHVYSGNSNYNTSGLLVHNHSENDEKSDKVNKEWNENNPKPLTLAEWAELMPSSSTLIECIPGLILLIECIPVLILFIAFTIYVMFAWTDKKK